MRKPILILVVSAALLMAMGAKPRLLEELRIGGGYGSTPDGGADFEADGDILTDGSLAVKGPMTSAGWADATLAAHWPLNEGAGATARDIGKFDHPGVITAGSGGWSDDSPYRHAFNFNASRIECGAAADLDSLGQQTITAWIKPTAWGGNNAGMIVSKNDSGSVTDAFFLYSANNCLRLRRKFTGGTGLGAWRSAGNSIALNRWQFVAVTYDHSNAANDPVFYVNGQVSSTTEETPPGGQPSSYPSEPLMIGNAKGLAYAFVGRMADVRVYRRILSADDIQSLYRAGSESPTFQSVATVANATIGGDLVTTGGRIEAGAWNGSRGIVSVWNGSGGNAPGTVRLVSPAGTSWYLFVEDDGTLKVHNALPAANTDGQVVGSQF